MSTTRAECDRNLEGGGDSSLANPEDEEKFNFKLKLKLLA
jgi:hypothetical protein